MWRAWQSGRPVMQTVRRSVITRRSASDSSSGRGSGSNKRVAAASRTLTAQTSAIRGFAETTKQRPQMATAVASTVQSSKVSRELTPCQDQPWIVMDGNEAAAYVAYAMSDISFIYPISPATSMGEKMDSWAASGKSNIRGQVVDVNMMQSEGGAAGALHGAAAAGSVTSTFTASQGLLLMIPNMYLLAGELTPTVIHVSARTVSKHALSIFNDHSDVMATRQTGFAMLCSSTVQEVMDLGLASHVATLKSRLPFMHFFDGYRTSAEMNKIKAIPYEAMKQFYPEEKVKEYLHDFALNPYNPIVRGTGQRPDIFFQSSVAANKYYEACPYVVEDVLNDLATITGRKYELFAYHGSPTAERVAIVMGSAAKTMQETVDYMNENGENVGVVNVHLYRPWSAKHFLDSLPSTAKKIAVLDRTREDGASGSPLFLDVNVTLAEQNQRKIVTGGQYGIASKEFTPAMAKAIYDNLDRPEPKLRYVIGINDDVTNTSLDYGTPIHSTPESIRQCMFWGLGSDGTVGANKTAVKTIGLNTDLCAQGHFVFDSHKENGVTTSHLRFGPTEIKSEYSITSDADYASCSHPSYVYKYPRLMLEPLKDDGIFVLNSPWTDLAKLEKKLPAEFKNLLAQKNIKFYNIDAGKIATEVGLAKRTNSVMMAVFYGLSGVLPVDEALKLLKDSIEQQYHHKGPKVVDMNKNAIDVSLANICKIDYPATWATTTDGGSRGGDDKNVPEFVTDIMNPVLALEGDDLPVSAFEPGGYQPIATTSYEKRGIAPEVPVWKPDLCTQCNYCAIVCPHAVIRPFLLDKKETKSAPPGFETRKAKGGSEVAGFNYSIQVSPYDCTGCAVCVQSCPDDALYMAPFNDVADDLRPQWDYAAGTAERVDIGDKYTVKGSQFQKPLLEFSGACAGCGETPYLKLATQLFGDRMVIANASGCSTVWSGTSTTIPFAKNEAGRGPAWGRSLFEDNAEYGFGMTLATKQRRQKLELDVQSAIANCSMPEALQSALANWIKFNENPDKCDEISTQIESLIEEHKDSLDKRLLDIYNNKNMLRTQSHWLVGGDGWAYDIGYGGLDHVLSRHENVNILVLDTEMYSNTGGQVSKATQLSTVTKFASTGKRQQKKDLGLAAMQYDHVYVASVALGSNMNQCVQAFKEAEHYNGPSLIIAYSPCIDWGIEMKYMMDEQKQAVDSGYWTLYRRDPRRDDSGLNPFQLDSRKLKSDLQTYLNNQNRFERLKRASKQTAEQLHSTLDTSIKARHRKYQKMAMDEYEMLEHLKGMLGEVVAGDKTIILYGSETGNAEALSGVFATEFKRRGIRAKCMAMDDFDFDDLPSYSQVYCVVATCGQGEFPGNCKEFWKQLSNPELPEDLLADVKFSVFGMGDSSYVYFNESAKCINKRFQELGAHSVMEMGLADDKDEERYETAWNEWAPALWNELGTDPPSMTLLPPTYNLAVDETGATAVPNVIVPTGTTQVPLYRNFVLTPPDYDRDIRHYEFDLAGSGMGYNVGDCLGIYPHNDKQEVLQFCHDYGLHANAVMSLEDTQGRKDPMPQNLTIAQFFTEVVDIFGKPARRFYETLMMAAKDPAEKEELEMLLSKEGAEKMKEMLQETMTHADLLKLFPSAKLDLDLMVDHIPRIKPRLYSIASASEMHGDKLHLCIVKDDWTTPSGRYREGTSTRYLAKQGIDEPNMVSTKMNAAGIEIPDTHSLPCVMVGLGTGIAPFRAMVEDREVARVRGDSCGPMALFFGARYRATDYTYGDEFEAYHSGGKGVLDVLSCAFSRDQSTKIYVQNRISENPEVIWDYLGKQKGYFYLCGPAGNVPPAVRKAVVDSFVKCGGVSQQEADAMVTQMQIDGRYNVEAW